MGGRGSYASGNRTYEYETVGTIEGVKVLEKINKRDSSSLPVESYSSKAYVLIGKDGEVKQYREFNDDHTRKFDIDYQHESKISKQPKSFHIHYYGPQYRNGRSSPMPITEDELSKYRKYFNIKSMRRIK
jgi:hypothetical protein